MRNRAEEQLQIEFINFFNVNIKDGIIYSNRNENTQGGSKGCYLGGIYKRAGRLAGVPDLTVLGSNGRFGYIEVKTPKAYLTETGKQKKSLGLQDSQKEFKKKLEEYGIKHKIAYDLDSFLEFLIEDMKFKVRATIY